MRNRFLMVFAMLIAFAATQSQAGQRSSQQQQLRANAPGGGVAKDTVLPPWPAPPDPLRTITPVTDTMSSNPPAGDWLTWRRTYDDMGFSALKQITKDNVKNLRVAWSLTLPAGPNEATPLVHDGVVFVHSYNDNVQALDATSSAPGALCATRQSVQKRPKSWVRITIPKSRYT